MKLPTLRVIARLLRPWRSVKRLEATVQRLQRIISDPFLTGIEMSGETGIAAGFEGTAPQFVAGMFMGLLQEHPQAVNYLELSFGSPLGTILVTVCRPGGATPHDLLAMAEQEARSLRAELEQLRTSPELFDQALTPISEHFPPSPSRPHA